MGFDFLKGNDTFGEAQKEKEGKKKGIYPHAGVLVSHQSFGMASRKKRKFGEEIRDHGQTRDAAESSIPKGSQLWGGFFFHAGGEGVAANKEKKNFKKGTTKKLMGGGEIHWWWWGFF